MTNLSKIKQAIRDKYAWPGGYPLYLVTYDGAAISIDSARENWRQICAAHVRKERDSWRIAGVEINWEDEELYCAHSGEKIDSAYGDDDGGDND